MRVISLPEVIRDHPDPREIFLCRKCRNICREAFYNELKVLGFPFTQPASMGTFGSMLLAALGRGVLVTSETIGHEWVDLYAERPSQVAIITLVHDYHDGVAATFRDLGHHVVGVIGLEVR